MQELLCGTTGSRKHAKVPCSTRAHLCTLQLLVPHELLPPPRRSGCGPHSLLEAPRHPETIIQLQQAGQGRCRGQGHCNAPLQGRHTSATSARTGTHHQSLFLLQAGRACGRSTLGHGNVGPTSKIIQVDVGGTSPDAVLLPQAPSHTSLDQQQATSPATAPDPPSSYIVLLLLSCW